jgi:hypothetical protein
MLEPPFLRGFNENLTALALKHLKV